jgi:hypothetical protein
VKFTDTGITMLQPDGSFFALHFCQFGPNYRNSRDDFVYVYGTNQNTPKIDHQIFLFRVRKTEIEDKSKYQYFAGIQEANVPKWSSKISDKKPILTDPTHAALNARIVYNSGIDRYLLTYKDNSSPGFMAILDAPEPWGPWTTVYYDPNWGEGYTFEYNFPSKWISADGKTMYMVYSGTKEFDSFTLQKVTMKTSPVDTTPTSAPRNLRIPETLD